MNVASCIPSPPRYTDRRGVETSDSGNRTRQTAVFLLVLPAWIPSMAWRGGKYPIPAAVLSRFLTSKPPFTGHRFNLENR